MTIPHSRFELVLTVSGKSRTVPLEAACIVGRGEDADLRIPEPRLSRLHCRFEPQGERVRVTDLGTSNGSTVDGQEISQVRLDDGGVVVLGGAVEVRVKLVSGGETANAPGAQAPQSITPPARPAGRSSSLPPPRSGSAPATPPAVTPKRRGRTSRRVIAAPSTPGSQKPASDSPASSKPSPTASPSLERSRSSASAPPRDEAVSTPKARPSESRSAAPAPKAAASVDSGPSSDAAVPGSTPPPASAPRGPAGRSAAAPRGARAPQVASRGRNPAVTLGIGAGLVILAVVLVILGREDPRLGQAREVLRSARAAAEAGEEKRALELYRDLAARLSDTPAGKEGAPAGEALEQKLEARAACERRLTKLLEIEAKDLPTREILVAVRNEIQANAAAMGNDALEEWSARARDYGEERAERMVRLARPGVLSDVDQGYFRLALEKVSQVESSPLLFGRAVTDAHALRDLVDREARKAYGSLLARVRELDPSLQRQRLAAALFNFGGTDFEGELRARIALVDLSPRKAAAKTETTDESETPSEAPKSLLDALARAEGLASRRLFAQAADAMKEVCESAPFDRRSAFEARRDRLQRLGRLVGTLGDQVRSSPERFRQLRLGGTLRARLTDVSEKRLSFQLGPGASASWKWERMSADRLSVVINRMKLEGESFLAAAELFHEAGDAERCLKTLARGYDGEPKLRPAMDRLVVEARGLKELPAGGFHLLDGRFFTDGEKQAYVLRKRIDGLAASIVKADLGRWTQAADELKGLGDAGQSALEEALKQRSEALKGRLSEVPALRPRALAATRARLFTSLEERRKAALALIFDKARYPYPYGPNQAQVQAEVDGLVGKVERIWRTPSQEIISEDPALQALLKDMEAIDAALSGSAGATRKFLSAVDERIGMNVYAANAKVRGILDHAKSVASYNDSLKDEIKPKEREVLRLTNAYRLMMGLRAVMSDDRLVLCARGHSQEMQDLGYFAHQSPTPGRTSPSHRARLAGWGSGVSENIARGNRDPAAVLSQWLHSSGHHRNVLGPRHTHLGVGMSSDETFWTQNFSTSNSKPPRSGPRKKGKERGGERRPR